MLHRLVRDLTVNGVLAWAITPARVRTWGLRRCGIDVVSPLIGARVFFGNNDIVIGRGTTIGDECFLDNSGRITIGENCTIGAGCVFVTSGHQPGNGSRPSGRMVGQPLDIGAGTRIGPGVTVLPGVTIGAGCVIEAGAVVSKSCAPHGRYAGVPARRIDEPAVAA